MDHSGKLSISGHFVFDHLNKFYLKICNQRLIGMNSQKWTNFNPGLIKVNMKLSQGGRIKVSLLSRIFTIVYM